MSLSPQLQHEIHILSLFNPDTTFTGIKVHQDAGAEAIAATRRLYDKGLITLVDGGYPTALGQEAVQHIDSLLSILAAQGATAAPRPAI
ncbi:MAG: TIGR02647 family protein [Porticoccaceae bacterium]|jgi:uncharacterized protein (TIGR02647 family)